MKLVFIKHARPPLPVHDREGRLLGMIAERKVIGVELEADELEHFGPGMLMVVRRVAHNDRLVELHVLDDGGGE